MQTWVHRFGTSKGADPATALPDREFEMFRALREIKRPAPALLPDGEEGALAFLVSELTRLPRPKAIVVVSAHWEARPLSIGATEPLPLIYDFYGFPEKFYRLRYPSPGASAKKWSMTVI